MPINTPPQVEVINCFMTLKSPLIADAYAQDLSRDPAMGESALKDPWIKSVGTGQSILDMIDRVCVTFSCVWLFDDTDAYRESISYERAINTGQPTYL